MGKSALLVILLAVGLTISCTTRGVNNIETGMRTSYSIYSDLAPKVSNALKAPSRGNSRTDHLMLTNQKLEDYRKAYIECSRAVNLWKNTGEAPENMIDLYAEMWRHLLEAQSQAATVYIYTSECTANTTLEGKACKN